MNIYPGKKPLCFKAPLFALFLILVLTAGCATAPHTQRSQFIMVPKSRTVAMGQEAAQKIKKEEPLSEDPALVQRVQGVGRRIAEHTDFEYDWEFNVVDKEVLNAFALPGGKVFVYRGLLEIMDTDAQLATVIAHEIAHVAARHGAERMSIQLGTALVGQAAGIVLDLSDPTAARVFQQAYGIGAQLGVILPYSRTHEYEADYIGLILMAKAGYDPQAAVAFWERMMQENKDEKEPPVWLSTHPLSRERLQEIKREIPGIKRKYYRE